MSNENLIRQMFFPNRGDRQKQEAAPPPVEVYDGIPSGWQQIKASVYVRGREVIVTYSPPQNDTDEPEGHDCDAMGCGWEHVLFRGELEEYA